MPRRGSSKPPAEPVVKPYGCDCRCTGYVKIIEAVKLSARILREGVIPEKSGDDWKVGSRVHRLDVEEKVLGYGKYPDDFYMEGMCYGSALRSK